MTLVDGAVKNNLPADILHFMGADVVIGVDLGYCGQPNYDIQSVSEILLQCIDIMSREVTLLKGEQFADIIIRPHTDDLKLNNTKQVKLCIERGAQATWERMGDLVNVLEA